MKASDANFILKFFTVVVVNCFTYPENLEYCMKIDNWLIPDIQNYYDLQKKVIE